MRIIDLGGRGREDYDDGIYDRRGGRSRRSDGTYMTYGGGIYDHHGMGSREMELERRERELNERERRLREEEMNRDGWFGERAVPISDEYEGMEPYMRRRRYRYY